jgi:hypothetical protein
LFTFYVTTPKAFFSFSTLLASSIIIECVIASIFAFASLTLPSAAQLLFHFKFIIVSFL